MCLLSASAFAQAGDRLYELEPYDLVVLQEGNESIKVQPIAMKQRAPIGDDDKRQPLQLRLVDRPEQLYEVQWKDVVDVKLFEELLLAAAADCVVGRDFEEAFEYYRVLEAEHQGFPGVDAAIQAALRSEAAWRAEEGQPDLALALLDELHRRNPSYESLPVAIRELVDLLVARELTADRPAAARALIEGLQAKYPDDPVAAKWRDLLVDRAATIVAQARAEQNAGALRQAQQTLRDALAAWPMIEGGIELAAELRASYPVVRVGVESFASGLNASHSWAEWRVGRLMRRRAAEPVRAREQGGEYGFPHGSLDVDGNLLRYEIAADARWLPGDRPITSHDLAAGWLAAASDHADAPFANPWRAMTVEVAAPSSRTLEIRLTHSYPRAEALMRLAFDPWHGASNAVGNGEFDPGAQEGREVRYLRRMNGDTNQPGVIRELVEVRFDDPLEALRALRSGEIGVLDRLAPADAAAIAGDADVTLAKYEFPTVHLLVPNLRRPRMAASEFRRALSAAIDSSSLITVPPLSGADPDWVRAIDGPFPIGYGYDRTLDPLQYDPHKLLAWSAAEPAAAAPLVIAHPSGQIVLAACEQLQSAWSLGGQGVAVELREATPEVVTNLEFDLLYVEWQAMEPALDAFVLAAHPAIVDGLDSRARTALFNLAQAKNENELRDALFRLHRLSRDDAWVLPLFQTTEHFAFRADLTGIAAPAAALYQSTEDWRLATTKSLAPDEEGAPP